METREVAAPTEVSPWCARRVEPRRRHADRLASRRKAPRAPAVECL